MNQSRFKIVLPHLIAVVTFIVAAAIMCLPGLKGGMVLNQSDITGWKGMAQQSFEYKEIHGHFPLWVTSMFSGMPGYQIAVDGPWHPINLLTSIFSLGLPKPMNFFFLSSICFYFLCMCLRVRPFVAIIGALGFAYCSYNPIIIGAGHETKILALAFAPALLGAMILIFEKKYLWGFTLTAMFTMIELGMNHQQISFYFFIVAAFMTVSYIINWVREKDFGHMTRSLSLVTVAAIAGLLVNALNIMIIYDFTQYSKRGGQLVMDDQKGVAAPEGNKTKGLTRDYAFQWSYGTTETFTLMYPGVMGYGARGAELGADSHIAKFLEENANQPQAQAEQIAASMSGFLYWGDQPFTEGPVYLGAVICFLFIFGMVYLKTHHKWWILAVCILAIFLSWGKNFPAFNNFLFDHLPLYNKFRAPAMTLVIPQLLFPVVGVLALNKLIEDNSRREQLWKVLKTSVIATAAVFLLAGLLYMASDFKMENRARTEAFDQMVASKSPDMNRQYAELNSRFESSKDNTVYEQLFSQTGGNAEITRGIVTSLRQDRASVFGKDIMRSLIYVALAVVLLGLFIRQKITVTMLVAGIALLTFFDLYTVGKKYLGEEHYIEEDQLETSAFPLSAADKTIREDKDPNFRVFNMASGRDPFQESITSYYHKSIGGYSPAKIGIYDDLISYQLSGGANPQVLNMLNTKYIIRKNEDNGTDYAVPNPQALGNAWFVKGARFVNGPSAEMKALYNFSARDTAIVDASFKNLVPQQAGFDSAASIKQVKFDNDAIQYESNASSAQLAVFSEIYYSAGWNAYIDGKPADYFRANYVLRAMQVPAGKHIIDFKFEPRSFAIGYQISRFAVYFMLLLLVATIFLEFRRNKNLIVPADKRRA